MLGDSINAALPGLRAHAESLMVEHGASGPIVEQFDRATNRATKTVTTPVYEGKYRLRSGNAPTIADAAGQQVTAIPALIDVPWHVTQIRAGHGLMRDGELWIVEDTSIASQAVRNTLTVVRHQ